MRIQYVQDHIQYQRYINKCIEKVECSVLIGVLGIENDSQWGDPSFVKPKPNSNRVYFLSDLRNINRQLKHKPYPIPNINEILLKLEGFQYATSLDLNMV